MAEVLEFWWTATWLLVVSAVLVVLVVPVLLWQKAV